MMLLAECSIRKHHRVAGATIGSNCGRKSGFRAQVNEHSSAFELTNDPMGFIDSSCVQQHGRNGIVVRKGE
jgi:hypothetical protein